MALQPLEKSGLITSDWDTSDNNRRARYYNLTASGRRALGKELESWRKFAAGLETVRIDRDPTWMCFLARHSTR